MHITECTYTEDTSPPTPIDNRSTGIPLHQISHAYSIMHIYWGYINPPQIQIDNILYGIMLHQISYHISAEYTYTEDTCTPHSNWQWTYGILLQQISVTYIAECTYTEDTSTSPTPIDNISLKYHYTK